MCALILGAVRTQNHSRVAALDSKLASHPNLEHRKVCVRSWITTDRVALLSDEQFSSVLGSNVSPGDIREIFNFLRLSLIHERRSDKSFVEGVAWIHQNFRPIFDDFVRHHIISLARQCDARCEDLDIEPLRKLVPSVIPIPDDYEGTWNALDELLAGIFSRNRRDGIEFLFALLEQDRRGVISRITGRESFLTLSDLQRQEEPKLLVGDILSEFDYSRRSLGFALFNRLGVSSFDVKKLNEWSDNWIALLLFQFCLDLLEGEPITRFLLAIRKRIEKGEKPLQDLYRSMLVYHMKNLPGGCMEVIKKRKKKWKPSIVDEAVEEAEAYFEALKPCSNSAVNSIGVPGCHRALRLLRARRSREFEEGMKKGSPLISMFSKSFLLYGGRKWRTYTNGILSEPSEMQAISTSAELPRMHLMHPDETARRDRGFRREIAQLELIERRRTDQKKEHER